MTDSSRDNQPDEARSRCMAAEFAAAESSEAAGGSGTPLMPKPTFSTFILSLASSGLMHLGEVPDPATGKPAENIALAKHSIDILSMLQEKTAGGLDSDETRLLEGLLYELRMKYLVKR